MQNEWGNEGGPAKKKSIYFWNILGGKGGNP